MMSDLRADVALLVDFTDLRHSLCPDLVADGPEGAAQQADPAEAPEGAGNDSSVVEHPTATEVARHLVRFASQVGRVAIARAYADWSRCAVLAREVNGARLEPVLVPATAEGEDRSHIRLVTDALEALYNGDEPDAFVLVTGDPTLLPLVQKLRADGSEVLIVAPDGTIADRSSATRRTATSPWSRSWRESMPSPRGPGCGVAAAGGGGRTGGRGARAAVEVATRAACAPYAHPERERTSRPTSGSPSCGSSTSWSTVCPSSASATS